VEIFKGAFHLHMTSAYCLGVCNSLMAGQVQEVGQCFQWHTLNLILY